MHGIVIPPPYTPPSREADRERIARDVDAFLANGNKVEVLGNGDRGEALFRTMREGNAKSMRKRIAADNRVGDAIDRELA